MAKLLALLALGLWPTVATERPTWTDAAKRLRNVTIEVIHRVDDNLWRYPFEQHNTPIIAFGSRDARYIDPFELGYPLCHEFASGFIKAAGSHSGYYLRLFSEVRKAAYEVLPKRPTELEMFMCMTMVLPTPRTLENYDNIVAEMSGWELTEYPDGTSQWTHKSRPF